MITEFRASEGAVESASDLVFAGYDLSDLGQDSGTDQWLGAYERSGDALDAYGEAFESVLNDWRGAGANGLTAWGIPGQSY